MPRMFKKKLHLCFFKINCLPTSFAPPITLDDDEDDDNYPQNILNSNNININQTPIIMKNYNSIYDLSIPSCTTFTTTTTRTTSSSSSRSASATMSTDDSYASHPPDIPDVFASQRFFVSSPGWSNSILDSSTNSPTGEGCRKLVSGGVPVKKISSHPYADFRRSMMEMIEARDSERHRVEAQDHNHEHDKNDWEFLQELLLCYLTLNPKSTHKLIIEAFSDVLVSKLPANLESCILN